MSNEAFEMVFDEMMNDIILEFSFQAHRAYKAGYFCDEEKGVNDVDIFGQEKGKIKLPYISCPKCSLRKEPSRMISHLSTCMVGKGRNSSRQASKNITESSQNYMKNGDDDIYAECDDDDSDYNCPSGSKKGVNKKKIGQGSRKRNNPNKFNPDQICGAISKHTKKLCKNSKKCPQHPEQQIQNLTENFQIDTKKEDVPIDVDTVDEDNDSRISQIPIFPQNAAFELYKKQFE